MTARSLTPGLFDLLARLRPERRAPAPAPDLAAEDRARRDFIDEMVSRNPDAFASHLDVQAMMTCFSWRF
ncbi:hypothetical protein HKCCE3408_02315 [Rhodobacterales bacterium HKCCE3408]|nr:hypothetical protein [Rhodobacterales bacterium HKCCE3408]